MTDGPRAAAIYCRISDDRTGEQAGVKRQEADCRKLAKARGWRVAEVYIDNDVSAYSGKVRPEYTRMLADIAAGSVDAVVTWHPDRLHRRPIELEQFFEVCDRAKVRHLASVAGDYDLASDDARMTARIMGAVSRKSSDDMARRIRRKHESLAAEGKHHGGGLRAFGYEADRVAIRATEARAIREAARRVLAGEAMTGIVHEWNQMHLGTAGGKVWDVTGLRTVLVSARISGRREHHGQVVGKSVWEGIISAEDGDRLRAMLGSGRGRRPGPPMRFLLSGFLRCGQCAVALATSRAPTHAADRATAGKYATIGYACSRHARSRPTACGRIRIRGTPLEALIAEMVFVRVDSPALAARLADRQKGAKRDSALDSVATIESDLQQLARDFGEGIIKRQEWMTARPPLERRLADASRRLDAERGTVPLHGFTGKSGALRKAWADLSIDRKRAILGVVLDHITIRPADPQKPRNVFDPQRVEVHWRA